MYRAQGDPEKAGVGMGPRFHIQIQPYFTRWHLYESPMSNEEKISLLKCNKICTNIPNTSLRVHREMKQLHIKYIT